MSWDILIVYLNVFTILVFVSHFYFFIVNIKIYQLVEEVEQEEGDGGVAGETFTDYVS